MEKHTRPYACSNPTCAGIDFGDKGGLQRHEKEKHGTVKFLCPISSCPRNRRGFGRKRNLDLHVVSRHQTMGRSVDPARDTTSGSPEPLKLITSVDNDDVGDLWALEEMVEGPGEMGSLKMKLQELETRKKELAESQSKVDKAIHAVKKTIQIMSSWKM